MKGTVLTSQSNFGLEVVSVDIELHAGCRESRNKLANKRERWLAYSFTKEHVMKTCELHCSFIFANVLGHISIVCRCPCIVTRRLLLDDTVSRKERILTVKASTNLVLCP